MTQLNPVLGREDDKLTPDLVFLDLESAGIRVASSWTEALPREQIERKLHEAVTLARERLRVTDETLTVQKGKE